MRFLCYLTLSLTLFTLLAQRAPACPMCKEAIPNTTGVEEDEQYNEARAYNHNIYMMVAVPYLLVGFIGLMVYRNVRIKAHLPEIPSEGIETPSCQS